jgi:hypothetical protein
MREVWMDWFQLLHGNPVQPSKRLRQMLATSQTEEEAHQIVLKSGTTIIF